jgi:dethiobiotin synthetase
MSAPISPHLAAAEARISISVPSIVAGVEEVRGLPDFLLLELPGGLFSPIGPDTLNIDLVRALRSDTLLLVAPDRLGVLHDVIAATRAARSDGVKVDGIILVTPDSTDPSTGRNAAEISHLTDGIPVLATLPRASPIDIASSDILEELLIRLETPRRSHTRFVPL